MHLKNTTGKTMILLLLVSITVLSSCSQKICSTYARSGDRAYTMHMSKGRSQIPTSYSASYKTSLQRKTYSR
jgi:hypothetical protein